MASRLLGDRINTFVGSLVEAALTPHPVDTYLEFVDPMATWSRLRAQVIEVEHRSPRTVTLTLQPTRQWKGFCAGQFVQVGVVINGVRHTRCFSPANAETGPEGVVELTITAHDGGFVSRHLRDHTAVGDVVDLEPAAGEFTLPAQPPDRLLFISGGSGITPVLSMVRTLVARGHRGAMTLIHYSPTRADAPYAAELNRLAATHPSLEVHHVYTRDADGDHFGPEQITALVPDHADHETFLCGPNSLMESVRDHWESAGAATRLHWEAFTAPSPAPVDPDAAEGQLSFSQAGTAVDNDGRSILDQAESAGLTPEFGCRMGICFSCTAVKTRGCTRNVLTGELDADDDQHIQLCISAPVGDVDVAI
ncbi:ferredoxin reductase [Williamsia sterculiae]|uniref:Ferredoxin-NADP reductase n=1 Tax=Williamsia sterculiae TaxID=1344003 RepID=A0A1N7DQW1_9NOCA|nr:FAD-binding oxidoreductase [Williamsia sterculiae]SIR78141.1 Ferredoxin-NADP reductase [Williamsia sterculiae]